MKADWWMLLKGYLRGEWMKNGSFYLTISALPNNLF